MSNQYNPYGPYYQGQYQPRPPQREPIDQTAMISLGLGIGSLVLSCLCPVISVIMGVFAILYGKHAMQLDDPASKYMGIAGLVCGIFSIVVTALFFILGLVLVALDPSLLR